MANDFVDEHDLTFDVLWDESFYSWQVIGISSQPSAVLLAADGTPLGGWVGGIPEDEVLRLSSDSNG